MAEVGVAVDPSEAALHAVEGKNPKFEEQGPIDLDEEEERIVAEGLDWRKQMSVRALVVGVITGFLIIFISTNIALSGAGVSPGFSVVAALIGFAIFKPLTAISIKFTNSVAPFTKQENCIIQGVATSVQSLQHALGVATWFFALHENVAAQTDLGISNFDDFRAFKEANPEKFPLPDTVDLSIGNMTGVAFLISFTGILIVTVFRKLYIVDLKLPFPSPVATAVMINSFFTEHGRALAEKQLKVFVRVSGIFFIWSAFNWMFSNGCGAFSSIPAFGKTGYQYGWRLNIGSYSYFIGVGMIMGANISYSIVLGGILSYGVAYPILQEKGGDVDADPEKYWFDPSVGGMGGFYGYKIMFGMMILLADGLFALCMMCYILYSQWKKAKQDKDIDEENVVLEETEHDREYRINVRIFTEDSVDNRIIAFLYLLVTVAGCIGLPLIYTMKWYMIAVAFILTPIFALIGNYIAGLTDWNLVSNFAKLAVLVFGMWGSSADPENAMIIALMTCGIVYCGASNSTDIIGDLVTGFLTRTSPKAMIIAQLLGFAIGCFLCPVVFFLFFNSAEDLGFPNTKYPNTYGQIYRAMAKLGTSGGFGELPKNALLISMILFGVSFFMPMFKMITLHFLEKNGKKNAYFWVELLWPAPMAAGIPFIAGTSWVVPVGIGLVINETWKRLDPVVHENFYQIVAAAIIVGAGVWAIPETVVALADQTAPSCLSFVGPSDGGWNLPPY